MAGAVREMLRAANIPLDLETAHLLQQSISLQGKLEEVTSSLGVALKVLTTGLPFEPFAHTYLDALYSALPRFDQLHEAKKP